MTVFGYQFQQDDPSLYLIAWVIVTLFLVTLATKYGATAVGFALTAFFALVLGNMTETQFGVAVLILAAATLMFGFLLMWVLSWLTATPVRVVRAALRRAEPASP